MSKLYPIGEITAANATGTIDGISYSLFEPNYKVESHRKYTSLISTFESQFKQVRKKAEPYISLKYEYENIYSREFRQIEHFIDSVEGSLTSFLVVDWSKGITPTNVSSGWVVSIDSTALFSTQLSAGANKAMLWTGVRWKLGTVSSVAANTSITLSTSEGTLTYTDASSNANLYPVYEVYYMEDPTGGFRMTQFIPIENVSLTEEGGTMYSGSATFIGKYKI